MTTFPNSPRLLKEGIVLIDLVTAAVQYRSVRHAHETVLDLRARNARYSSG